MSELENTLKEKVEALEEMHKYETIIRELKDKIDGLNKQLYKICEHNWIRDTACSDDDLSKKYCDHCGLRDYNMYR